MKDIKDKKPNEKQPWHSSSIWLVRKNVADIEEAPETEITGVIENINSAVVNGNTVYYIKLEKNDKIYTALVTKSDLLPFATKGQTIKITVTENSVNTIEFTK